MSSLPIKVFESGATAVPAGTPNGGWVSGNPAGMVDGATLDVVFDLGSRWDEYSAGQVTFASAAAGGSFSAIQVYASDTAVANTARRLRSTSDPAVLSSISGTAPTGNAVSVHTRPMGRFIVVRVTNTATFGAQLASAKIVVAVYES